MNVIGFKICMKNDGYTSSLELHKIYPLVPAHSNDPDGYIRIIDESGEDYLFPQDWFESVSLGKALEDKLAASVLS